MTTIATENALVNGETKILVSVPSDAAKKRLYFSIVATNFGNYDNELWLTGVGFGTAPNLLANAVYLSANDYLPNRSQWKYPHKLVVPQSGSITGFIRSKTETEQDWSDLEDFHAIPSETWDNPGYFYPADDKINLSMTYAEVK